MKMSFFTPDTRRGTLRLVGFALAVVSVVLPAFPLGPFASHPLLPMASLWAAYGWASEASETEKIRMWRGAQAPATLALLGLVQDQLSGGPLGLFVIVFLSAYLLSRLAASAMRSPNVLSLWAGYIAMSLGLAVVTAIVAPWARGGEVGLALYAQSYAVTALLFPIVRPLYMDVSTV